MQGLIIAGTHSGCGKTTTTMGLMHLLQKRGIDVSPFKVGPDYIDPMFHRRVLGKPSYNLDGFMLSEDTVRYLYQKHSNKNSISIIEGVMGLFDGYGKEGIGGASHLSKILGMPVLLVISAKSLYQSVAAIAYGYSNMDPNLKIGGIILNHVGSADHYSFLKNQIEEKTGVPCIGYVPTNDGIQLNSRHLGLVQADEVDAFEQKLNILSDQLEHTIDIEKMKEVAHFEYNPTSIEITKPDLQGLTIAVARDEAFTFYYQDNLELLKECGAELKYFSPLHDKNIPENSTAIYLGGGYPELYTEQLSKNTDMILNIRAFSDSGKHIYGECGGLMYLCKNLVNISGESFPMVGIFNASVQMTKRLKRFGYADLQYQKVSAKCHEFHCSELVFESENNFTLEYSVEKPDKNINWECGLRKGNTLAGYAHVHFYSNLQFMKEVFSR